MFFHHDRCECPLKPWSPIKLSCLKLLLVRCLPSHSSEEVATAGTAVVLAYAATKEQSRVLNPGSLQPLHFCLTTPGFFDRSWAKKDFSGLPTCSPRVSLWGQVISKALWVLKFHDWLHLHAIWEIHTNNELIHCVNYLVAAPAGF